MLVSPALNPALREARFDGDTPLDPSG
ncbi:histidine phosphatase family protein, partial [Streptomyces sp. SID4915]|nr:histidine phosphatase family protein [Streptomyces sp. SID4915]